jgi:Beta-galactosidase/beta-glucuronidase
VGDVAIFYLLLNSICSHYSLNKTIFVIRSGLKMAKHFVIEKTNNYYIMNKTILITLTLFLICALSTFAQDWQPKQARIMTPWAEQVDPQNPLPEYPRPQMVRDSWMNLNGLWDFTKADVMAYSSTQSFDQKILVPFPMESALSGIMNTDHANNKGKIFLYRRTFTLPSEMDGRNILLHFGAVDWKCQVYINGTFVGEHKGGFDPFYFDITSALNKSKKEQEVQVFVQDYQEYGGYPHGKQKIDEKVIWYTPVTGIWQTVWLESVSNVYIERLVMNPDIDKKKINVKILSKGSKASTRANVKIFDGKKLVASKSNIKVNESIDIKIPNQKLWSPDSPFLYDMKVELVDNGRQVDAVDSYFGMRKISMGMHNGYPCMMLNNEYSFQYGFLDQGYWPDGIYTAPTDEALKFDLIKSKEFGMNMSRKHIKVEPARWYYHCDKLGILVWQDMPNPGFGKDDKILGEDMSIRDNFHDEMIRMVESLYNHPSIVMWTVYNESWGQPDDKMSQKGVDIVREQDPTRLISIASGWNDSEYGDIKDTHWYPEPNMLPNKVNKRVSVCGEYGGITLIIDNHRWIGGSDMKYTQVYSQEELKDRFIQYVDIVRDLQGTGMGAAVYTQLTDVEDEENGVITYDRKVVKVNDAQLKQIRDAVESVWRSSAEITSVMGISQTYEANNEWKYMMVDKPLGSDSWKDISFVDSSWKTGKAGFGHGVHHEYLVNTKWDTPYIYLRKNVTFNKVSAKDISKLKIQIFYDEDCDIYINGVLAASVKGHVNRYVYLDINKDALTTIQPGKPNLIAVKCKQTEGGQFIDLGFSIKK